MAHDNEIDSIIYYWSLDHFNEIGEIGEILSRSKLFRNVIYRSWRRYLGACAVCVRVCEWNKSHRKWIKECEEILVIVSSCYWPFGWDLHIIFAHKSKTIDGWRFPVRISMQSLAVNLKHHLTLDGINNTMALYWMRTETKTFGSGFMYNVYVHFAKRFRIQLRFQLWKVF